jgi:hypothetical protein
MNRNQITLSSALLGACVLFSAAPAAHADFEECGSIFVSADAKCEWRKTEQCMTECKTETVETACSAKLYTSCQNECTASASTTCTSGCSQSCTTSCTQQAAQPEPPNCMGLCRSDCAKTCDNGGHGQRGACCAHGCNRRCEDKCKDRDDPIAKPAECTETCMNACSGSCTAQATLECQLNCQTDVYTECETETVKTCETKCKEDGGAIFCDGQFVNATNARSCADELKAKLDFDIDVKASVTAVVDTAVDGTNTTKKKSKEMCSVGLIGASSDAGMGGATLLSLCAGALTWLRARRRR